VYLALSTYNFEFVAVAVSTKWTWSSGNSCCANGHGLGSQQCCFGSL